MKVLTILSAALVLFSSGVAAGAQSKPSPKAGIVAVIGCLKETAPNVWRLTNATDATASGNANQLSAKEIESMPKSGKHEYELIGVGVFNLPAHRNHAVGIKGLHIKAVPVSRLNMTSLAMVSENCPPAGAK